MTIRTSLAFLTALTLASGCAATGAPSFRMHVLNAASEFEAAGVFDVDRDGRPDIFCGGFWYHNPGWERHPTREIRKIDNYYLDFSALPADIDGDGWTDVVSCDWHEKRLFWVRNPGTNAHPWEEIVIDRPGNLETAVQADVNGDGRPDVIPCIFNGRPGWYEFQPDPASDRGVRWVKHDLPEELAGAGIGTADINDDGRLDIVGGKGWAEQPPDAAAPWVWHGEFDLIDASIPVQVYDVDGDGDLDLVWGIGHGYGLYWLEQERNAVGLRTWARHEIDRQWSQAHVVLRGDIDGDGLEDIVTGKRYYAHNGHDPGAEDPRVIYWYAFDRAARRWTRHVISENGPAGLGLATVLYDIDGDGDLDVVAPGKSGLYLFENLRIASAR